jgi:hypothetical protein
MSTGTGALFPADLMVKQKSFVLSSESSKTRHICSLKLFHRQLPDLAICLVM